MDSREKLSVQEAKERFAASVEGVRPVRTAMETRPLLLLAAAAAAGVLAGRSGRGILKKTGSIAMAALTAPQLPLRIIKRFFL